MTEPLAGIRRLFDRLGKNPTDSSTLALVAQEAGYLLPSSGIERLRELRAEIAENRNRLSESDRRGFLDGVFFGLLELTAAYSAELRRMLEGEDLKRVGLQKELLEALYLGTRGTTELAELMKKNKPQISRALAELRAKGYVNVVPAADQRERPYQLTPKGHAAVQGSANLSKAGSMVMKGLKIGTLYDSTLIRRKQPSTPVAPEQVGRESEKERLKQVIADLEGEIKIKRRQLSALKARVVSTQPGDDETGRLRIIREGAEHILFMDQAENAELTALIEGAP